MPLAHSGIPAWSSHTCHEVSVGCQGGCRTEAVALIDVNRIADDAVALLRADPEFAGKVGWTMGHEWISVGV